MKRMSAVVTAIFAVAIVSGCGTSQDDISEPQLPAGVELQPVNNAAAFEHIDQRLESMTDQEKLEYLTVQSCAADMAMSGVYGHVDNNPLMQRINELNVRYKRIFDESKEELAAVGTASSLAQAEDTLCPDDHPKG